VRKILKKGGVFVMSSLSFFPVNKSLLDYLSESISLIRKRRGLYAPGDLLLHDAIRAIKSSNFTAAENDLKKFLQITPDVQPEERAVIENSISLVHPRTPIHASILKFIGWFIYAWITMKIKSLMNYKKLGHFSPV